MIRIGWTIAEEAKHEIMRRPDRFANLGKTTRRSSPSCKESRRRCRR